MYNYKLPKEKYFEHQIHEKNTHLLILRNSSGMEVAFTDYGARIVSIIVPSMQGHPTDVVLGFSHINHYLEAQEQYHGACIGRYAGRIAEGTFSLDSNSYTLAKNNGPNSLHGGKESFHTKVWDRRVHIGNSLEFYYSSPDGEEGFPGKLNACVIYTLTDDNKLIIQYRARTDKKTIVNLTNHTYFNLNGEGNGDILNHYVQLHADAYLPVNEHLIPKGEQQSVEGTAFDFRNYKPIYKDITQDDEQLKVARGYDHSFVNKESIATPAAAAYSLSTGIKLEVFTTEPGIHLYTGNFLSGADSGKSGKSYLPYAGLCFETQHFPDSPNQLHFPSVVLEAGEEYISETHFKFSLHKD